MVSVGWWEPGEMQALRCHPDEQARDVVGLARVGPFATPAAGWSLMRAAHQLWVAGGIGLRRSSQEDQPAVNTGPLSASGTSGNQRRSLKPRSR